MSSSSSPEAIEPDALAVQIGELVTKLRAMEPGTQLGGPLHGMTENNVVTDTAVIWSASALDDWWTFWSSGVEFTPDDPAWIGDWPAVRALCIEILTAMVPLTEGQRWAGVNLGEYPGYGEAAGAPTSDASGQVKDGF